MIRKLFSIRDTKANIYNMPFPALTQAEAERAFQNLANDARTTISTNPEDYDLYFIGDFDDVAGKFDLLESPKHIQKAVHLKA